MEHCFCCPQAIAYIYGNDSAPHIFGQIKFYQKRGYVLIVADISGLPPSETGFFGFHIHEGAMCKGENFSDTKGHYNPETQPHPRHAGDLPPLLSCDGRAYLSFITCRFTVNEIIGKTVVIHDSPDDFTFQPSGNAGEKIACGEILKR